VSDAEQGVDALLMDGSIIHSKLRRGQSSITVPSRLMQLPPTSHLALDLDRVFVVGNESFQEVLGEPPHIVPLGVLVVA
jgi:hypothetical protein